MLLTPRLARERRAAAPPDMPNDRTKTAAPWMMAAVSACAAACTVYDTSLLPPSLVASDATSPPAADASGDAGPPSEHPDADAVTDDGPVDPPPPDGPAIEAGADGAPDPALRDAVADRPADVVPSTPDAPGDVESVADAREAEAASSCDAACMARCADGVMTGTETGVDCGGECPKTTKPCPAPRLSNLVVNDTTLGNDGIANNTQWSLQPSLATGLVAFGDRTYTIGALSAPAQHLAGKPWIRAAIDSRNYVSTSQPLGTVTVAGTYIYVGIDVRHATAMLTAAGYSDQNYPILLNEGNVVQTFNVWRKPIVSSSETLPATAGSTGSFYVFIVE